MAILVGARCSNSAGKAGRAAADQGYSTDDQQQESRESPHKDEPIVGSHMRQQPKRTTDHGYAMAAAVAMALAGATNH